MRVLTVFMAIAMITCMAVSVSAFTTYTTHIIDNDDDNDEGIGYFNERTCFDNWFRNDRLYFGEARKQDCDSSYYEYAYYFPVYMRYTPIFGEVSAYLYNVNFTDPAAMYGIGDTYTYFLAVAGTINQDLAATGWNVIGTAETTHYFPENNKYASDCVKVIPSSENNTGKTCGADAIKVKLGY